MAATAQVGMKISDMIASNTSGQPLIAFEYFPPKTESGVTNLLERMDRMKIQNPAYADVTWGAGGGTSDLTLDLCVQAKKRGLEPNMHLTCTNMEVQKIEDGLNGAREAGIVNIVALRGDPPAGQEAWKPTEGGFSCALDLVKHMRAKHGDFFCISVAGYPEGHPTVINPVADESKLSESEKRRLFRGPEGEACVCSDADYANEIAYLKSKVDAGANLIITQMFFDVEIFLQFAEDCKAAGINVPIVPGLMLISKYAGFKNMVKFCKTSVPAHVAEKMEALKEDADGVFDYGVQLAAEMSKTLTQRGAPVLHFYTLNVDKSVNAVLGRIGRFIDPRPMLSGNRSLKEADPTMFDLIEEEKSRQLRCIELIASENFTSKAVLECLGSVLTNKYSEGQPNARYYGGNEVIDKIENLCKKRALDAFSLDERKWGVNVQPYSGSPANFAVYTAMLPPHARVMGLDLPSGGHLTHGYYTAKKRISATSIYFESLPYKVHPETGLIDFDELRKQALLFRPAMILCGASAYPRVIDFAKFREIADEVGALLMADIAHISGLVATKQHPAPFDHCDVVTTTTHKSLRGPRAGMIFFRYSEAYPDIKERIDMAVFPGLQGGPHNHQIGALAAQLLEVNTAEFVEYSKQVCANAKALAAALKAKGHKLASDGTDNHLILWDLRPHGLTGGKVEKVCDAASISLNRNCVHGDASALSPGGVRIGTPSMTTRGCKEDNWNQIAEFLDRVVKIALKIQEEKGKKLKDFELGLKGNKEIEALKKDVEGFAFGFGFPGL